MLKGIPIGRAFGISLSLHYSWFFIFAVVTWGLATGYFPLTYPNWSTAVSVSVALITSVLFFASVLAHELMHSRVAQAEGMTVNSIVLFALGGVSQIAGEPKSARDEFRMAIAGPLTSIVLGLVFGAVWYYLRGVNDYVAAVAYWLGLINVLLGFFNLIPGFPLDGGRVFRSLIWWRTRDLRKATHIASTVGRGVGYLMILGGIYLVFSGNWFNGIWFALIGWFLESSAVGSYRQMILQDMLKVHVATEVMNRDCMAVPPDLTVEKLISEKILAAGGRCFPVVSGDIVQGLITLDNVRTVPAESRATTRVSEAMLKLDAVKSVPPNQDLYTVMRMMAESNINQLPVVLGHEILGMIGRDNLINFINTQTSLRT